MNNLEGWVARSEAAASGVIARVMEHLPEGGSLYDVGANVGVVTSYGLTRGRVVAFEPVPDYADICQERNPRALVYKVALGAEFGTQTLWCDTANPGWNTFVEEKAEVGMTPLEVTVVPLDSLEESMDVLKIDVEGAEAQVVAGAAATIQRAMPVIVMELGWGVGHPDWAGQRDMMEWLFSIGYGRIDYELEGTGDVTLVPDA